MESGRDSNREVAEGDGGESAAVGPVLSVDHRPDHLYPVGVVLRTQKRVQDEQLAVHVHQIAHLSTCTTSSSCPHALLLSLFSPLLTF